MSSVEDVLKSDLPDTQPSIVSFIARGVLEPRLAWGSVLRWFDVVQAAGGGKNAGSLAKVN